VSVWAWALVKELASALDLVLALVLALALALGSGLACQHTTRVQNNLNSCKIESARHGSCHCADKQTLDIDSNCQDMRYMLPAWEREWVSESASVSVLVSVSVSASESALV